MLVSCGTTHISEESTLIHEVDLPTNWGTSSWKFGKNYFPKDIPNQFASYKNNVSIYERVTDSTRKQIAEDYIKRVNEKFLIKSVETGVENRSYGETQLIDMSYKRFGETFMSKAYIFKTHGKTFTIKMKFNEKLYKSMFPTALNMISSFRVKQ